MVLPPRFGILKNVTQQISTHGSGVFRRLAGALGVALTLAFFSTSAVSAAHADVNDFSFDSLEVDYHLSLDEEGRSVLRTEEHFIAVFPDHDQNRGIRRLLPQQYNGWPTDLSIVSVTDENGQSRGYETDTDDGILAITVRASDYLHGQQSYQFVYDQRNVTRWYEDTGAIEFYWDVNGTGWAQPFDRVIARVHLTPELAARLADNGHQIACYAGSEGASTPCSSRSLEQLPGGGVMLTFRHQNLGPHQTLTFAIGFEEGSITPRDSSLFGSVTGWLQSIAGALSAAVIGLAAWFRRKFLRDEPGRGTIVPQYEAPKAWPPMLMNVLVHRMPSGKGLSAQLLELSLKGVLRIVEQEQSKLFGGKKSVYGLELLDASKIENEIDQKVLEAFFPAELVPGQIYWLNSTDTQAGETLSKVSLRLPKMLKEQGLIKKVPNGGRVLIVFAALITGMGAFLLGVYNLVSDIGRIPAAFILSLGALSVVLVMALILRTPRTAEGTLLSEYLEGVKLYLTVAEADRIRVLQSPGGALREMHPDYAGSNDPQQLTHEEQVRVVQLHEKLLPYAVIFGVEKEWTEHLGKYYEQLQTEPAWYSGNAGFSAGAFSGALSSFSSSTASSFASSSSGGSSGGGGAGGGGGGGGGGGV